MTKTTNNRELKASFRDPSGFLFTKDGVLYRQVNQSYAPDFALLKDSGLYDKLIKAGLLIPHIEADIKAPATGPGLQNHPPGTSPIHILSL